MKIATPSANTAITTSKPLGNSIDAKACLLETRIDPFNPSNTAVLTAMVGGGGACIVYAALAWRGRVQTAEQAKHWTTVDGEILSSEVIVHPSTDDDIYEAQVRYTYDVAGRKLVGNRLRVGAPIKTADEQLVRGAVAPYRAGARVRVRYDPNRPEQSVLEPVPSAVDLKLWLISGVFLLATSAFVAVTLTFPCPVWVLKNFC